MKAVKGRQTLVEDAMSEQKFNSGETDIHASARSIIFCHFFKMDTSLSGEFKTRGPAPCGSGPFSYIYIPK